MGSTVSSRLGAFLQWWGDELQALLPDAAALSGRRAAPRLVLSAEGGTLRLLREASGRSETLAQTDGSGREDVGELLRIARSQSNLPLGIRLPNEDCFSRVVELPARARKDYASILALDMERSTPFRSADVLAAHYLLPSSGNGERGHRAVRHVIVKRRSLEPLIASLRSFGVEPAFADCWDESGRAAPPVDFLAASRTEADPGPRVMPLLAGLAAALVVAAVAIIIVRQQNALNALQLRTAAARQETAEIRERMEASRAVSDQLAELDRLLRARLSAAAIIEELTVRLPDGAWAADLRLDGETVEFSGFAPAAAALVPLLERSALFQEAALTAPVVLDPERDRERFGIRLSLTQTAAPPDPGDEPAAPAETSR